MANAMMSFILSKAAKIMEQQIGKEPRSARGVENELEKLKTQLESIKAVIVDAEKRQVMEETVKTWLEGVRDLCYEVEDVLDDVEAEMNGDGRQSSCFGKVNSFLTLPYFRSERITIPDDIAIKIKKINGKLDDIAVGKYMYKLNEVSGNECFDRPKTASFIENSEVEGRDVDKKNLIGRLLCDENQERCLNVISIVGMGGIGKTTLAKNVFNYYEVVNHFDRAFWVCVSPLFDEVRIAKAILEVIEKNTPNLIELETVVTKIRNYVKGKKFLLVLDDVWANDFRKWEHLFNSLETGKAGSTILLTTRKKSVARLMGSSYQLCLGRLSEVDSWTLFEKIAFFERKREDYERLEKVGRKIVEKCKGLPLAIKTMGSLMRFKSELSYWEEVVNSELWELEEAKELFPPLMLSYCDLPSYVKPCFLFCAIFPKDHTIEANNLVQLWMAQGYLTSTDYVEVEVVGQDYLQNLAMRSFFQDVVRDKNRERIVSVKMHDIVHHFAHCLTKQEYSVIYFNSNFQREMESSHKRARHLTVVRVEDTEFPNVPNAEKLSTLRVQSFYDYPSDISQLDLIKSDLIRRLPRVRALDFSRNRIGELPKEIGNLVKLKYLNLSHNPFWELPETLCDMYNLQILKLFACARLRRLPQRISKLVKLRHLEIDGTDSLMMLPKGIADLASLWTLSKFIVSPANDGRNGVCGLADLQNLNKLRGRLRIEGLGNAADAAEAKKAELRKKIHLFDLEMDFRPLIQNASQDGVIEALEAPHNLQSLQITSYQGTQLPKWMMKLTKLQTLFLQDCQNCTSLPPLGPLPLLAELHLEGMSSLKCLDLEFLGSRVINEDNMANGGGEPAATSAFPNLKKLKISKMESWEEWNVMSSDQSSANIMPRLRCLEISHCSKLKALPPLLLRGSPLRKLRVYNCRLLHQLYNKESGELWSEISRISKIRVS